MYTTKLNRALAKFVNVLLSILFNSVIISQGKQTRQTYHSFLNKMKPWKYKYTMNICDIIILHKNTCV